MNNHHTITQFPGIAAIKDNCSKYISISQDVAKLVGWKAPQDCEGKTDYDLPCKAAEYAEGHIKNDKIAMASGLKLLSLEFHHYSCGWKLLLADRTPILNSNKQYNELFIHTIDISETGIKPYLTQIDSQFVEKNIKSFSYILSENHCPLPLTEKQQNCLFFFIRGRTLKEIAKILKISPRTVESHIEAIKLKLGCHRRTDLIEKSIHSGYLFYIPKSLQKEALNNL